MGIAVITGASTGIGREFARQIAGKRYSEIWLIARSLDKLEQVRRELPHDQVRLLSLDLTQPASWRTYLHEMQEQGSKISLLLNCAGIAKIGDSMQVGLESSLEMIDLNVRALTAVTLFSLPLLEEGARIIEMCSASAFQPLPYLNVYAASKAYVLRFSQALAYELRGRGVTVTAVCPNWVATPFIAKAKHGQGSDRIRHFGKLAQPADVVRKALRDAEKGRLISSYGWRNRLQQYASRFLPPSWIMSIWHKISS